MSSSTCIVPATLAVFLAVPGFAQDKAAQAKARARVTELLQAKDHKGAEAAAKEAIEADPDDLEAHLLLLKTQSPDARPSPARAEEIAQGLERVYRDWARRFPTSSGVPYGIGSFFYAKEDPRAKPYLERAVELDPKLAKAWQMLSIDAERWGNATAAREYLRRATQADPENPDYAFYHANSFHGADDAKWVAASLDVARRFPDSNRGAQALYWLGVRTQDDAKKIAFWEQSRRDFPPEKFSWSRSSMSELFEAHLRTDPAKAVELAKAMPDATGGQGHGERWADRQALAEAFIEAKALVAAGRHAEARLLADALEVDRLSSNAAMIARLKAEVAAGSGDVRAAYDALAERLAATPEDSTLAALHGYARRLGKTPEQVDADVWAIRDRAAKPAPDFELDLYTSDRKASLRDYRGKVVLLTFWFPGCGPCRGEFPHFENVIAKFRGRDVIYLGINGETSQDPYVLPFMEGTKYSFVPLRADDRVLKPEAYGVRGFPANFLIDRAGRIVYQRFRTDGGNELLLQRMIESLLERPAGSAEAIPAAASRPGPEGR